MNPKVKNNYKLSWLVGCDSNSKLIILLFSHEIIKNSCIYRKFKQTKTRNYSMTNEIIGSIKLTNQWKFHKPKHRIVHTKRINKQ